MNLNSAAKIIQAARTTKFMTRLYASRGRYSLKGAIFAGRGRFGRDVFRRIFRMPIPARRADI